MHLFPLWSGHPKGEKTEQLYPGVDSWPDDELYFNTRYVYAHSEFTPQQTMRGKTALYGYLLGMPR
ncbi:MAG: hypothetical protein JXX14_11625 [Deltaproteobacteria bacterium]|nr:hypothetical protein [Deltaproteobacteria bacterium]